MLRGASALVALTGIVGGVAWQRQRASEALESEPIAEPWAELGPQGHWLRPNLRGARMVVPDRPHRVEEARMSERRAKMRRTRRFSVSTNADRLRMGEITAAPAPGVTRLVAIGDSVTFGWGVEEDEAWPARLSLALGRPVSNGGVPGYTSHQGLLTLQNALSTRPERVLIAYLVRDADPAPTPDHSRAPRAVPDLRLMTALRQLRPRPQGQAAAPAGPTARVPADRYLNNLRALKAQAEAAGAEVSFVVFPMLRRPEAHLAALHTLSAEAQVLSPALPPESFFAEDPIHLTAEGHDQLARQLAEALR